MRCKIIIVAGAVGYVVYLNPWGSLNYVTRQNVFFNITTAYRQVQVEFHCSKSEKKILINNNISGFVNEYSKSKPCELVCMARKKNNISGGELHFFCHSDEIYIYCMGTRTFCYLRTLSSSRCISCS